MRDSNDNFLRDKLKGIDIDFEQASIWSEIDAQLDDKKERKKRLILFLSLALAFILVAGWMIVFNTAGEVKVDIVDKTSVNSEKYAEKGVVQSTSEDLEVPAKDLQILNVIDRKTNVVSKTDTQAKLLVKNKVDKSSLNLRNELESTSSSYSEIHVFQDHLLSNKKGNSIIEEVKQPFLEVLHKIPQLKAKMQFENKEQAFILPEPEIQTDVKKEYKHTVSILAGLGLQNTKYFGISDEANYLASNNNFSKDLFNSGIGVSYGYQLNNHWVWELGMQFNFIREKLNFSTQWMGQKQIVSDSAYHFTYVDGTTSFFSGEQTADIIYKLEVQHFNSFLTISPFTSLKYFFSINDKYSLYASAGIGSMFQNIPLGRYITKEFEVATLQKSRYKAHLFQTLLRTGLTCSFSDKNKLMMEFQWTQDLNSRLKNNELSEKKSLIQFNVGMLHSF